MGTTWDEFDKMRQDMMSKSKDFWDNCNKDMSNFDEAVRKSHSDMDMGMAPFRPQLPAWAMPDSMKDKWMPMMKTRNDEVIKGKDEDQKSDEKNTANSTASGSSHVMRQFSRKWTLPSECNPNEVASNLSSDGILMITAPKKALTSQVPVQKVSTKPNSELSFTLRFLIFVCISIY